MNQKCTKFSRNPKWLNQWVIRGHNLGTHTIHHSNIPLGVLFSYQMQTCCRLQVMELFVGKNYSESHPLMGSNSYHIQNVLKTFSRSNGSYLPCDKIRFQDVLCLMRVTSHVKKWLFVNIGNKESIYYRRIFCSDKFLHFISVYQF